ncbi:MAG: hypothetical protein ACE147_01215 [Candidatus Methylomirabilales bacterium]
MRHLVSPRAPLISVVLVVAAVGWLLFSMSAGRQASAVPSPAARLLGGQTDLGKGTASTYAEVDGQGDPAAIGVVFSRGALEGLPTDGSDYHHCFDRDQNGTVDRSSECLHSYEYVLPLPDALARRGDVPFKWVLLNWNPAGHVPPGVYDVPHFDVHFYMEPIANVFALQSGPCGPELIRCDQFAIGKQPVPPDYLHPDFRDVDAVVPAMGNHLVDLTGPEFHKQPFTRSWIYGAYAGQIIFWEEMVAHRTLLEKPQSCSPIKLPKGVATSGFYPTVSCLRHDEATGETTVSLERFAFRSAAAAAASPGESRADSAAPRHPIARAHPH